MERSSEAKGAADDKRQLSEVGWLASTEKIAAQQTCENGPGLVPPEGNKP